MASPLSYSGGLEAPVTSTGERSPSDLEQQSVATQRQWDRATHRFHVARFAATMGRESSNAARQAAVVRAMEAGIFPRGPVLSRERIRLLVQQWDRGDRSIAQYMDGRRRSGVRPTVIAERLMDVVDQAVLAQRGATGGAIRQRMLEVAEVERQTTGALLRVPSLKRVRQLIAAMGVAQMSAARHGAAAAEIDGLPHSTVPASTVHEVHTLDEFTMRRYAAMWDPTHPDGPRFVSFKPEVVFIIEHVTRACVGFWVIDPSRRLDPATKRPKLSGFDQDDVLAALLSVAFPPVATAATRQFAGYLPTVLRWDNAKAHTALAKRLTDAGFVVPEFPTYRPINRGLVERAIGTIKRWCDATRLPGHEDRYIPADRVQTDGDVAQAEAAATQTRRPTRTVIPVDQLPRIAEIREELELVVRRYNYGHRHRAHAFRTPLDMYREHLPREGSKAAAQLRPGRDILAVLPVETTKVGREGLVHRGTRFSFVRDTPSGPVWMSLGTPVTYRADPMLRALYAEGPNGIECLPRVEHWAKGQDPKHVAEQQTAIATELTARAVAARETTDALELGTAALARGKAEAAEAAARAAASATDESDDGGEAETAITRTAPAPAAPGPDDTDVLDPFADHFAAPPQRAAS